MGSETALVPGLIEKLLWTFVTAAQVVLLLRLWMSGLWKIYRFFFALLILNICQAGVLASTDPRTDLYAWIYMAFVPLTSVCILLVILEIYHLILKGYAGIGTLSRWVIAAGLAVSFTIAVLSLYPNLGNPAEQFPLLLSMFVVQRAVYSAFLAFLLFITAFLVWFPVPLNRNSVLHVVVFGVYFSTEALLLLVRGAAGADLTRLLSMLSLAVEGVCLLAWILLLTKEGEKKPVVVGHRWRPGESEHLIAQLDTINSSLLRAARK